MGFIDFLENKLQKLLERLNSSLSIKYFFYRRQRDCYKRVKKIFSYVEQVKAAARIFSEKKIHPKLSEVVIVDVVDNDEIIQIINRLHTSEKKFNDLSFDIQFKQPFLKKSKYVWFRNDKMASTLIANVTYPNKRWGWRLQIISKPYSDSHCIVEYRFFVNMKFRILDMFMFINENISLYKNIPSNSYDFFFYKKDQVNSCFKNKVLNGYNTKSIAQQIKKSFEDIFFNIIAIMSYSYKLNEYKLPIVFNVQYPIKSEFTKEDIFNNFWEYTYVTENCEQITWASIVDYTPKIIAYSTLKSCNPFDITQLLAIYRSEFYLSLFHKIEYYERDKHIGAYYRNIKKYVTSDDLQWLNKKILFFQNKKRSEIFGHKEDVWFEYWNGQKRDGRFLINYPEKSKQYLEDYKRDWEYLQTCREITYSRNTYKIAIWTAIIAFISLIISILSYMKMNNN